MGKKPKIKKIKNKKKITFSSVLFFFISLILTLFVFVGLIIAENVLSEKAAYVDIVVASKDIPAGEVITSENVSKYFKVAQVDIINNTKDSLSDINSLVGKKAIVPVIEGEIVLLKDFTFLNEYTDNIKEPVQIGINIGSLADAAGGIIREGDLINISVSYKASMVEETEENSKFPYASTFVIENVYVDCAMDNNGEIIKPADTEKCATLLLLTVEKETEILLSNAMTNGSLLRVSKVLH